MLTKEFQPNWISAPSDTVLDILNEKEISIDFFSEQMNLSKSEMKEFFEFHTPISLEKARKLEKVIGSTAEFWLSRDYQYRNMLSQPSENREQWIDQFPFAKMVEFGWIENRASKSEKERELLNFFKVNSISQWNIKYSDIMSSVAFRKSGAFETSPFSVAAWIKQGEILANSFECDKWNKELFLKELTQIRSIIREKNPKIFIPFIKEHCAKCGVAFIVLRTPTKCPVSGVTKFITSDKALIQLSFRFLSDDHFWFSFFHEAGHLILHNKQTFIEDSEFPQIIEEEEANNFSQKILLSKALYDELMRIPLTKLSIANFGRTANLPTGVVVGQLQHAGRIGHQDFNLLKQRYLWE